jgi:hypothetical protein
MCISLLSEGFAEDQFLCKSRIQLSASQQSAKTKSGSRSVSSRLPSSRKPDPGELRRIHLLRLYEKSSNSDEPPRHEANHRSVHERFSARTKSLVIPKLILLLWSIQAIVRSTIHLFGKKGLGPFRVINFSISMASPSLFNSLTHARITSSGASFLGCRTISAVHPKTFLTQPAPLS